MRKLSLPVSQLIRENMSILMTFAFSREPLQQLIEKGFSGEWKNLQETVFSMSEQRAEKACPASCKSWLVSTEHEHRSQTVETHEHTSPH